MVCLGKVLFNLIAVAPVSQGCHQKRKRGLGTCHSLLRSFGNPTKPAMPSAMASEATIVPNGTSGIAWSIGFQTTTASAEYVVPSRVIVALTVFVIGICPEY